MKIASRIIDLRIQAGLTRYSLSQMTGIPQSQLQEYETGKTTPTIRLLTKITNALGCTLSEFFSDDQSILYLSKDETSHINQYRTLTLSQKKAIDYIIKEFKKIP